MSGVAVYSNGLIVHLPVGDSVTVYDATSAAQMTITNTDDTAAGFLRTFDGTRRIGGGFGAPAGDY